LLLRDKKVVGGLCAFFVRMTSVRQIALFLFQ
jgi:hypothetical protein